MKSSRPWLTLTIFGLTMSQLLNCADPEGGVSVEGDELGSKKPAPSDKASPEASEKSNEKTPEKSTPKEEEDSSGESPSPDSAEPEPEPEPDPSQKDPGESPKEESPKEDPESSEPEPEPEPEPDEDKPLTGEVDIAFTTKTFGGRYGPRNVGAAWIETKDGKFLRTVKVWAKRRAVHLVAWNKSTKGSRVDAVSGATLRQHQSHTVKWDRKDVKGKEHGAGEYVLKLEMTEENSSMSGILEGPFLELPFELGKGKEIVEGKDQEGFEGVEVKLPG